MPAMRVHVRRLPHHEGLPLPRRATSGSSGWDVVAAIDEPLEIASGSWLAVPTGLAIALPEGYEAQVRPRSGLARKFAVTLVNSPGTVDADYRGELQVIVINHGPEPFVLRRGDRFAQIVFQQVPDVELEEVSELPATERGAGGFGHTGIGGTSGGS